MTRTTRGFPTPRWAVFVLAASMIAGAVQAGEVTKAEQERSVRFPPFEEHLQPPPGPESRPAPPDPLQRTGAPVQASRKSRPGSLDDASGAGPSTGDTVAVFARRAARRAAFYRVERFGWAEYYRVGFHRGLHAALDAGGPSWRARALGLEEGAEDPEARAWGAEAGEEAARTSAWEEAERRVAEQYRDLSAPPRFDARPDPVSFSPRPPRLDAPDLERVFDAVDPAWIPGSGRRYRRAFGDWDWTPARLRRCEDYREFYRGDWADAQAVLSVWRRRGTESGKYRGLEEGDRENFDAHFVAEYEAALDEAYRATLLPAYEDGFEDGWRYARAVLDEQAYRQGYVEGFARSWSAAAEAAFYAAYPVIFEAAYRERFEAWASEPRIEIVDAKIDDAGGDGVVEPGEEVRVYPVLANYGGADGTVELRLEGPALERGARGRAWVPGRSEKTIERALAARVRADVVPKTAAHLGVRLRDTVFPVTLRVAYPVEFAGLLSVDSLPREGRVSFEVLLGNQSLRPVEGTVRVRVEGAGGDASPVQSVRLDPGARRPVRFELTLDPLTVLGGRAEVEVRFEDDRVVHDRKRVELPNVAADLARNDILWFLLPASDGGPRLSGPEVEVLLELLRDRLARDYWRAVAANGNPYKRDLRSGGAETALGGIVRFCRANRDAADRSPVLERLRAELPEWIRALPGVHPRLKKAMRRLGRRV